MRAYTKTNLAVMSAAVILLLINCLMFWYVNCSGGYSQSRDIYGTRYFANLREEESVLKILNSLPSDDEQAEIQLNNRLENLKLYRSAALIVSGESGFGSEISGDTAAEKAANAEKIFEEWQNGRTIDPKQAAERIQNEIALYENAAGRFSYITGYGEYVGQITEKTEFLTDISLFSESDWIMENIRKTERDFSAVRDVKPTAVSDNGMAALVNFKLTDILAVISVLLIIPVFLMYKRCAAAELYAGTSGIVPAIAAVLFTAVMMYAADYLIANSMPGGIPLSAPIQSFTQFRSCCYPISAGGFMAVMLFSRLAGIILTAACVMGILSLSGKARAAAFCVISAVTAAETVLAINPAGGDFAAFAREINLISLFSSERFFLRYLNLNVNGSAVSRLPVFAAASAVIILAVVTAALTAAARFSRRIRTEAERNYFAEINRRYDESRKLRHDITNHLLAISRLIDSGNIEDARKYISEVTERADLAAQPVRTGSEVLDALLFSKSGQAAQNCVSLEFDMSASVAGYGISDYDLCTILGNILDNAIEAASVLPGELRVIRITIGKQMDMLYISCENNFSGELQRRGDRLLTTKSNPISHGYGIPRVTEAAGKYGGTVRINAANGRFLIEILLNK